MLSPGTDTFDLILWHLTGYYYTWHPYYIAYSWLSLWREPWQDYYTATRHLVLLNSWTPEPLYSWTPVSPALLLLLIAQSDRRPAEHAWCSDDKNVSHDRASVLRILNGTKCHTEQSVTPHTWWGPPLESVGATSRIHSPQSKVSHGAKCHTIHVVGGTSWICGGYLLNLWGYFLPHACVVWCFAW